MKKIEHISMGIVERKNKLLCAIAAEHDLILKDWNEIVYALECYPEHKNKLFKFIISRWRETGS